MKSKIPRITERGSTASRAEGHSQQIYVHRKRGPGRQLTWIQERNTGSKRKTCHQNKRGRADTHQHSSFALTEMEIIVNKVLSELLGLFQSLSAPFLIRVQLWAETKGSKAGVTWCVLYKAVMPVLRNCVNHFTASIYEATLLSQEAADSCFLLWWRGDFTCDKTRQWLRWRLRPNRPFTSSPHASRLLNPLHHYCELVSVSSSHHVRNTLDSISKKRPLLPEAQQWLQTFEITFQLHLINL